MKKFIYSMMAFVSIAVIGLFCGCGKSVPTSGASDNAAGGGDLAEVETAHVTFAEGKGLLLDDETRTAIGVQFAPIELKAVDFDEKIQAHVFRLANEVAFPANGYESGMAYATTLVPANADTYKIGVKFITVSTPPLNARLVRFDRQIEKPLGLIELIFAVPDQEHRLKLGDSITLQYSPKLSSAPTRVVPRGAVLHATTGDFIYIANGSHLLRTIVKLGRLSSDWAEVLDGVSEGTQVAVQPVETLYLTELRLTKGGGHAD